ncbi:MAG TPA: hypothetical protein VGG37_02760 [Opitutaceae bacterium]|jgi:hypothetical protein
MAESAIPDIVPSRAGARLARAAGFALLLAGCAWAAARFQGRGLAPASALQVLAVIVWAAGLQCALLAADRIGRVGRPTAAGYARAFSLAAICCGALAWYFNARRVGPLDAQWYENAMIDFLGQARAGRFPVVIGESIRVFNGAVHPFRSAPWQFVLAQAIDLLTGRALAAAAIEHIMAVACLVASALVLYAGFRRAKPASPWLAWCVAAGYAASPAALVPFIKFDMYMTLTAQPFMAAALLCLREAIDRDSVTAWTWTGIFGAALWYCHPPMALLTCLVCAACGAGALATRGPSLQRAAGIAAALLVFGFLAAPYFRSIAELSASESLALQHVVAPAAALVLCLLGACGFLRSRSARWLALLPAAFLGLCEFAPTLVPFAGLFCALMAACALWAARIPRRQDAVWTLLCALAAAWAACAFFPGRSLGHASGSTAELMAISNSYAGHLVRPATAGETPMQPGFLLWALFLAAVALAPWTQSECAKWLAGSGAALVAGFGVAGRLSAILWQNAPSEVTGVIAVAYDLRLVPIFGVVCAVAGFFALAEPVRRARISVLAAAPLLLWSLWQLAVMLSATRGFSLDESATADKNRTENVVVERYSWDLLAAPRFISFGAMDPALEVRFWSDADRAVPAIGPDDIEKALEQPGQRPLGAVATPIPTGRDWLTLAPRIDFEPGEHRLLRFDFQGNEPAGWLIFQGTHIYREYQLPSSGREYAFGYAEGNSRTISLWNSGPAAESVQILIKAPKIFDPAPGLAPYWLIYSTPFDAGRSPIDVESLAPLRIRVAAPTDGYLESFRSWVPGYKATLDGEPVAVHRTKNSLVGVRVAKGSHEVVIRFAGTTSFHTDIRWAETAWILAALAGALQLWRWTREASAEPLAGSG